MLWLIFGVITISFSVTTICYYASGSTIIGLICGAVCAIVTFKLADWTQPVVEEAFGLPGVSFPTSNSISWAPLAYLLDKLYDKIPGLNKLKADPESIQKNSEFLENH